MNDDIIVRLKGRRTALLQEIGAAASTGDTSRLLSLTERLRITDQVVDRLESDVMDAELLLNDEEPMNKARSTVTSLPASVYTRERVAGRSYGAAIRSAFLLAAEKRGMKFSPLKGSIFTTAGGKRVGIAVATERQHNRWFLGLPEDAFSAAVLLCQTNNGRTLEICLPEAFFDRYGRQLSRSSGQVKFNVVNRDGRLFLTIPGISPVAIDQYEGAVIQL